MAGQVKDWVYKKIDWAYNTGSWQWAVDVATTAELFKLFSSTVIFTDAANVYDNKFYGLVSKYDGLIIRPITGSNGYTGVMHFNLYEDGGRYKSDMEGLYGEYTLRDLVLMIFKACGLDVDEAKRTYWINQVMSLMVTMPAERSWVCNTSIRPAGGYQVAAYVDKAIVDDIIDCMRVKGMFESERDIIETILPNTVYNFETQEAPSDTIARAVNNVYESEHYQEWMDAVPSWLSSNLTLIKELLPAESVVQYFSEKAALAGYDITDDTLLANVSFKVEGRGTAINVIASCDIYNYVDDEFISLLSTPINRVDQSEYDSQYYHYEGYRITANPKSECIDVQYSMSVTWELSSQVLRIYRERVSPTVSSRYIHEVMQWPISNLTTGGVGITCLASNYGEALTFPEGITLLEGAVAPKSTTSSSNFWPSWAGRAVTVHGYSGSNHPTYTYIPVGYGDYDYEGFTQARVQSGWIYNDNYLQKLGLSMELLPEYEPVEPDPGDDEPIRPDPDPTPDPTPEEEEPLDLSANRLFTVHTLTNAEVNALGGFLYSSTFIEAIKNMFTEPMDAIIGCFILNYGSGGTIPTGSNETLKLGSVLGDSGVTGTRVTNQTFECSFGTVTIGEFYHNVEDYAPYSSAQIFLPYIGFCDLDINEIMNSSITLKYRFDVYTGACLARLFVRKNGVLQELYNFEGNSAVHIPLTGRDFTNSVSSLITGAVGVIGGAATGNPIASVMGARSLMGSTIPTTRRSGSLSANIGVLGGQKPFILIKRPKAYNAAGYNNYYGYPSNWSVSLGDCSGYTRVKDVHLDALACTDAEREEIETLLREGVIF